MMKELRARGPIAGDIVVPLGFGYYKSGIFSDDHMKQINELADKSFVKH
jgi:hypothetical protein